MIFPFFVAEGGTVARWKVSAKIQQLLNTLKKPKKRHLEEFYEDDDIELEMAANPKDPNAPSPEGSTMTPAVGPQLVIPAGLPRNLEAAIQRYGSATYKAPAATVLDPNGKMSITLTYGKLLSRSHKIGKCGKLEIRKAFFVVVAFRKINGLFLFYSLCSPKPSGI